MKNIRLLTLAVKQIKLKTTDFITADRTSKSKVDEFYKKVLNGELVTDMQAASYFFSSDTRNPSYKNLKSTLKSRLINTIFFFSSSSSKYSPREKALLYCTKYMAAAEILIYINIREVALELFNKVLKKSLIFGFADINVRCLKMLRSHYALREGNLSKFNEYNEQLNYYLDMQSAELEANEYYQKLMIPYVKNKSVKVNTHEEAKKYFNKLKPYLSKFDSPFIYYMTSYIESLMYISVNNYEKTAEVCGRAIEYLEAQPYIYITAIKGFIHQQTLCYIQLKKFEEGSKLIQQNGKYVRNGTYNWYLNLTLHLTLAFHTKRYQDAYHIFNKGLNNKNLRRINDGVRENWKIFEFYIHFLIFIGKVKMDREDKKFNKVNLGRFLNKVPVYSKDKRGMNIPILIIQILFLMAKNDFDRVIERTEAIEKYCSRYLKKEDNFRSNCFIKMLLKIPVSHFHRYGVERNTQKLYDQLKSVPIQVANQPHEIEIIPYEDLWEMLLSFLTLQIYKAR